MTDCERQDGQTAAVLVGDLTRRLLRRATAPIGVIDARQASDLHLRASLWIGRRAKLLENLKSRYGVDQGKGGTVGAAVTGNTPFQATDADRFDLAPVPPSAGRGGSPEAAIDTVSKISWPPAAQYYRVKRPNTRFEPNPSKPLSSQAAATQSGIGRSANLVAAVHPQHKTSETRCGVNGATDRSALPPPRAGEADTRGQAEDKLASRHDLGSAVGALLQVSEAPRTAIAPQMRLPALALAPTRDVLLDDHTPTLGGPTSRAPLVQRIATPIYGGPTSRRESLPGEQPPRSSSPSLGGLLVQRKAVHSPAVQATRSVRSAETINALPGAEAHSQSGRAMSVEIRPEPWSRGFTKIVWRKAEPNGASRESAPPGPALAGGSSHAGALQIMRECAEAPVSNVVATSAIQASAGNGVGVAAIAEQVSRIIARQLRTERERRGRTR